MTKQEAIAIKNKPYDRMTELDGRWEYIEKNGYVLWHDDLIKELKNTLNEHNIKTYIEAYAGTGHLSRLLNDIGVSGKGYTLDPKDMDSNGFTNQNEFAIKCIEDGILEYKDILDVPNDEFNKDMLVLCWIPYEGGDEILEHLKSHTCPKYILHVGEGYGGCTGSDELNDYLHEHYDIVYDFKEHVRFNHIRDNIELLIKRT
jgi:hypothetical protein